MCQFLISAYGHGSWEGRLPEGKGQIYDGVYGGIVEGKFLDALRRFCAELGLARVVLAGHSMGGQIAVHFTSRHPDIVEKLILIDPYGLKGQGRGLRLLARLGPVVNLAFLLNARRFIRRAMRANVLHEPTPELLECAVESTAASILGRDGARVTARMTKRIVGQAHVDPLLPMISQETLLLWGDHDRLLPPSWAEVFASRLPRVVLHRVAGAGHMPMLEKPEAVAGLVAGFLDGGEPGRNRITGQARTAGP